MWLSKIDGSISRFIGMGISVDSGIGSKSGKDIGVNINSKIRSESQNLRSGSHWLSSSIFLKWKLVNLSIVWN